jgi:excisionase family DNA binding protein
VTLAEISQQETKGDRPDGRYCTIAQAAQRLQVHRTTVQRWISSGKLRAYRVGTGTRTVRILERDLEAAIRPAHERREGVMDRKAPEPPRGTILTEAPTRGLTDEEISQGLAALERLRAFREELAARHPGPIVPSSEELIREEREERSKRR